eukprot:2813890-Amphidinium_carterae.1
MSSLRRDCVFSKRKAAPQTEDTRAYDDVLIVPRLALSLEQSQSHPHAGHDGSVAWVGPPKNGCTKSDNETAQSHSS